MTDKRTYTLVSDDSHGWLKVPLKDILEIEKHRAPVRISEYSYVDEEYAYLEEDCDANMFLDEAKECGFVMDFNYQHHLGSSPIRSLPAYKRAAMLDAVAALSLLLSAHPLQDT